MSANIVLPTLTALTQSRVTSLLTSTTASEFGDVFDSFFDREVNITVNGKHLSRQQYKEQLLSQSAVNKRSATVNVSGELEVKDTDGELSGLVGIFYTAIVNLEPLVGGAPAQTKLTSSLNVIIKPTAPRPPQPPHVRGYFDPRRVVTLNQVYTDQPVPFHLGPTALSAASVKPAENVEFGPGPVKLPTENIALGPGPVKIPHSPFGPPFGPGPVRLPPSETGATPEQLPGDGEFGPGPVILPGSVGEEKN
ncbi:hypothetical protein SERLA73DRAFT_181249 [Serpula lacrymans var. lacrymans S7.3]|uniref:NTF2 domain-containing protein n=2 Tax=Serpula lacrymans var. lacrymans TaxID=341189 RepID=F8PXR0_SERL3|nr:uncharacterized protein SERLADRAFT_467314 [Serpula lacrymans var. lacrymans S7.9]EGN98673.1 hypothetical protein SERLA73DRAFT_181249 [Serpula lacrymans var. lacrymans S7.3]EGO24276.1 hypothetical protein SERLADRAFT_467314 [Serpula lacrymans var. lacrymans S7.9]